MVSRANPNRAKEVGAVALDAYARASLEAMIDRVKAKLAELGPAVALHERELAEAAILDALAAIQEGKRADKLRARQVELEHILLSLTETAAVTGDAPTRRGGDR
ncbi:MAG: hypothetical protein AB1673_06510 [Actinomycetota bacterium]